MNGRSMRRITLGALALLAVTAGAEAQDRLTLRALYGGAANLSGTTSAAVPDVFTLNVAEKNPWYAFDVDLRFGPGVSLELTASRGKLEETLTLFPPQEPPLTVRQTGTLRHDTISLLFHPVPGEWVDVYFGPSYGQAYYDRAFTSNESESALGGKVGVDLHLGETRWLVGAQFSVLTSGFRVADGEPRHNLRYTVLGAGLGYRF